MASDDALVITQSKRPCTYILICPKFYAVIPDDASHISL